MKFIGDLQEHYEKPQKTVIESLTPDGKLQECSGTGSVLHGLDTFNSPLPIMMHVRLQRHDTYMSWKKVKESP